MQKWKSEGNLFAWHRGETRNRLLAVPIPVEWVAGIVLAVLLNVTANSLPDKFHSPLLRWGWFSVLFYFTYLVMSIEVIQRKLLVLGGSKLGSYVIAGLVGAVLAVVYWAIVNSVYSKLSHPSQQSSDTPSASKPPPAPLSDLRGDIAYVTIGSYKNTATVAFILNIRNLGNPSIVTRYHLDISAPSKETLTVAPSRIGHLEFEYDKERRVFTDADSLVEKTAQQPVPTGGSVTGHIVFICDGLTVKDVDKNGTLLTLYFEDVTGKPYTLSHTWKINPTARPLIVPGIRDKVISIPTKKPKRRK